MSVIGHFFLLLIRLITLLGIGIGVKERRFSTRPVLIQ
jgi:hypothetical protein